MPSRFAPALLLDVLAFWFVLRWVLPAPAVVLVGRALILMMLAGALTSIQRGDYVTSLYFAASVVLAWALLRHSQDHDRRRSARRRLRRRGVWGHTAPSELAALCERRIGRQVDAAVPATIAADPPALCVVALAGDGIWVLEDTSRLWRPRVGRVLTCWARQGVVAHVEHRRRGDHLELSWPAARAFVRALLPSGATADQFAGHLVADELASRP
jgi:hypothetical protein